MSKGRIDLHCHTTASDGTCVPSDLVNEAFKVGLSAIAITDHDSVDGIYEATDVGNRIGVVVVPGIELSTEYVGRDIHILGYYMDKNDSCLSEFLEEQCRDRRLRAEKMVCKLNEIGVKISFERVLELSDGGSIGRPHIARALVESKFVTSWTDAFNKYIGKRCYAYVERSKRLTPFEAIKLLHKTKGAAVLAHPGISNIDDLISELIKTGLDGIECVYPAHSPAKEFFYRKIAIDNDLVITAGSDFHGAGSKTGVILGKCTTGIDTLDLLKGRCKN